MDKRALSRALGWPESRWKNLEGDLPWGESSKAWVQAGLLALVARMDLPEDAGPKAVRYVMGESKSPPWSEPPTWREGMCPAAKAVGRPRASTSTPSPAAPTTTPTAVHPRPELRLVSEADRTVVQAVFSPAMLKAQVEAVMDLALARKIDRSAAANAIGDLCDLYYNKHERHSDAGA